ncbi:MAG: hypothetical protein LRY71_18180 [Bacillaceae bacterium]|nr:hypothetical protein [Bacillaceae bacterium]
MTHTLQFFIEYKVNPNSVKEYECIMEQIVERLPEYGAEKIEWFISQDEPYVFMEKFTVPTLAYYHALKKYRKSKDHQLFGQLDPYVEGGLEKLKCWAFQTQSVTMKTEC